MFQIYDISDIMDHFEVNLTDDQLLRLKEFTFQIYKILFLRR